LRVLQSLIQRLLRSDIVRSIQHSPTSVLLTSRLLREVYYLLYADGYEKPSKVAIYPEEPSLGRIRADSVAPPHSPTSIKRCISRVEKTPALIYADLFPDSSCDTPLKEGHHISILRTDDPGLSPDEPMAIVLPDDQDFQVESLSMIRDGRYLIKSRAANHYWSAGHSPISTVCFYLSTVAQAKASDSRHTQVNKHSPIIQSVQRIISLFEVGHHS
jgi:hypothetical protein